MENEVVTYNIRPANAEKQKALSQYCKILRGCFFMLPQYNGNISQAVWQVRGREKQSYTFQYDFLLVQGVHMAR